MSEVILVLGATGKQGSSVITALLSLAASSQQSFHIRAISRTPSSPTALSLANSGVEVVKGDFKDKSSLEAAFVGVQKLFLMTTPLGKSGAKGEEEEGKLMVDLAKKSGVNFICFTSVGAADQSTGVPHFDSKFNIEEYIKASGIAYTFLRPVAFYDNFPKNSGLQTFITLGLFDAALYGRKLQMIAVEDIGYFAAEALTHPQEYGGRAISLAGDELSMSEVQACYEIKNKGSRPWKLYLPSLVLCALPYDFRTMLKWFYVKGYNTDIEALRKEYPKLLTFQQWLDQKDDSA